MGALDKTSQQINRGAEWSIAAMGLTMALVVAAQVFWRYVLNQSLFWSEELARYLLVWLTFLGTSVAYRRQVHPGVDVISRRLPETWRFAMSVTVHIVSLLFFGIMVVYGIRFAYFVRLQISPALGLPKWIVFMIIPLSGAILFIHGLALLGNSRGGPSGGR